VTIEITRAPVERTLEHVPVAVRGLSAGRRATLTPGQVTATVRGSGPVLARLTASGLDVYADLSGLVAGRYNLPVRYQSTREVAITRVEPLNLDVTIR
jgi:YbbR domain-containing protein